MKHAMNVLLLVMVLATQVAASSTVDVRRGGSMWATIESDGTIRKNGSMWGTARPLDGTEGAHRVAALLVFFSGEF